MVENDSFNGLAQNNSVEAKSFLAAGGRRWGRRCAFCCSYSMMQKVHSGVVVYSEGAMVRIEGDRFEGVVAMFALVKELRILIECGKAIV